MMATVGQGSASMASKIFCASRTSVNACSAFSSCTNSFTSAPAMNPEDLAERSTRPRGGFCASAFTCESSSTSVSRDNTLVEVPGLSKESHAMPSSSDRIDQAGVALIGNSGGGLGRVVAADVEVAEDGAVIGEPRVRHFEVRDLDFLAHEHEV